MNQPPIAIAVTWGKEMIDACGGWRAFYRFFLETMNDEDDESFWYHKCKNKPQHDIIHVYIVVGNVVRFKMLYAGFASGPNTGYDANGEKQITWSRLLLAGPYEKSPFKISMKGFQGFRYLYEELF